MIGSTVSHYKILAHLGEGGMGVVYKARDTRLDRMVALKFLAPSLQITPVARNRFFREARSAAAANHPNICTIYEIGEVSGTVFIAMEYIEGRSLRDRIEEGRLQTAEVLPLCIQIAEALNAAHQAGVIHRDVKSSNIMLGAGRRVKILDFGLARLATHNDVTVPGEISGTLAYMSPEQVQGATLDERTDIWSFGAVMYEMLSGRLPFEGDYIQATMYSILNEQPAPLASLGSDAPAGLQAVIERLLAKDLHSRYPTMADVISDLRLLTSGAAPTSTLSYSKAFATPASDSIAVLPFVNMSPGQDDDYFSDGLTDEIISTLTQVTDLRVISRTSAFQFKGRAVDVRDVAKKLHVGTLIEGTVRRTAKRVRVSVQLVNTNDGCQVWSKRFDRQMEDVFDLQDELTTSIVDELRALLRDVSSKADCKRYTENAEALQLYLQGRFLLNQQTGAAVRRSIECFQAALEVSPEYALPHVGLGDAYSLLVWYGLEAPLDVMPKAKAAAQTALAIDDTIADAHRLCAVIAAGFDWNWTAAKSHFQRALALGPGFSHTHFQYALDYLTPLGELDEARREIQHAQHVDPLSLIIRTAYGGCLYRQRHYERAVRHLEETVALDSGFYHSHWTLGRALEQLGRFDEAMSSYRTALRLSGPSPGILADIGHCLGSSGNLDEAQRVLDELQQPETGGYLSPVDLATVCLGIGDRKGTFRWLQRACEERARSLIWLNVDPRFDPVRSEPEFCGALQKLGLL